MRNRSLLLLPALPLRGHVAATQEGESLDDIWLYQNRIFWCHLHYCCYSHEHCRPKIPVERGGEGGKGGGVEEEPWQDMAKRKASSWGWENDRDRKREWGLFIQSMINQSWYIFFLHNATVIKMVLHMTYTEIMLMFYVWGPISICRDCTCMWRTMQVTVCEAKSKPQVLSVLH